MTTLQKLHDQATAKIETVRTLLAPVLADSFGGIMYNVANQNKYDNASILKAWNTLTPSEQSMAGGIINGAISFIQGK